MTKKEFRLNQMMGIGAMTAEELKLSNHIHPASFYSPMEGLGILEEERFEANKHLNAFNTRYNDFKFYLCEHQVKAAADQAAIMKAETEKAIAELLQVAAMCQKFIDSQIMW